MNSLIKFFLFTLSFSLLLMSCRKDSEEQMVIKEDPPAPVVNVYGNIFGMVTDGNNEPVPNASVAYNNETLTTDAQGLFLFQNVKMNTNGTYVTVEKDGFFMGSRRLYPQQNATNYVDVKLLDKTIIGSVNSSSGGTLTMQNGAKIDLPANGIIDADGNSYNGSVEVAMQWLDPTAEDLAQIMPGSLEAINAENQRRVLQSYGMLAVELETPSGAPLNLGNGGIATLTFPVPSSIIGSAPETIPLWFFDEVNGIWKEEGSAQLVGNEYVGEVNHFTFWNCDAPFPLIELSGCFEGLENTPLSDTEVNIEVVSTGLNGFANTDDKGCFTGLVPLGETLILRLIGKCGTVLYETEIGPFDVDTDLGLTNLSVFNDADLITVTGTLVDCDGAAINDAILKIDSDDGADFYFITNGSFNVPYTLCETTSSISLSAASPTGSQTTFSEPVAFPVEETIEAGDVTVCIDPTVLPDTYMRLTIDGESYTYDLEDNSGGTSFAQITTNDLEVFVRFRNIFPFDTTACSIGIFDLVQGQNTVTSQGSVSFSNFNGLFSLGEDISFKTQPLEEFDVFISEIGEVGEYVIGSIEEELEVIEVLALQSITPSGVSFFPGDSLGTFPISIEFRVRRTQ